MSGFVPELGQAAFGGPWEEIRMQGFVKSGLSALGELCKGGTDTGEDPTSNTGAEFVNDVFELRSYCWCDGEGEHAEEGCPPNFKHGDFEARWYKYLGRSGSQNRKLTAAEWDEMFEACVASVPGTKKAKKALRQRIEKAVGAAIGDSRAVTVAVSKGGEITLNLCLNFPRHLSDRMDAGEERDLQVGSYVDGIDRLVERALRSIGATEYSGDHPWNRGEKSRLFVYAQAFPPMVDDDYAREVRHLFEPMTEEEVKEYEREMGHPPFSDDYWKPIRYAGINVFRAARLRGES